MPNPENLRTPTSEEARAMQAKGVKKRKENQERKKVLINAIRGVLNGKMSVNDSVKEGAAAIGYKIGSKASFGEIAVLKLFQKALKNGDYKAFIELGKMAGLHFDQSEEGRGGTENPLNIAQTTTLQPESIKKISEALEDIC